MSAKSSEYLRQESSVENRQLPQIPQSNRNHSTTTDTDYITNEGGGEHQAGQQQHQQQTETQSSTQTSIPKKKKTQNSRIAIDRERLDDDTTCWSGFKNILVNVRSTVLQFRVFLQLAATDVRKRRCSYVLGFLSVFLVVFLCVIFISTLYSLPLVFLRLAETDRSQLDLEISTGGSLSNAPTLNYTLLREIYPDTDPRSYHSPRITFSSFKIVPYKLCTVGTQSVKDLWYTLSVDPSGARNTCRNTCVTDHCPMTYTATSTLIALDVDREARMGFGADWKYKPRKGHGIMGIALASALGISKGDTVILYGDVQTYSSQAFNAFSSTPPSTFTIISLIIDDTVEKNDDKFTASDFIAVDYASFIEVVGAGLSPDSVEDDVKAFSATPATECAVTVNFNVESSKRQKLYSSTNYEKVRGSLMAWIATVTEPLGYSQLSVRAPLLDGLYSTRFFSIFIGLIMSMILAALAFLSIVLIYSLLNVSLETRTYEIGLQRIIGFTRESITFLVLTQAYLFAIPAWVAGLIVAQLAYLGLRVILQNILNVQLSVYVSGSSIGWATLAGLLIPAVAAIFPIINIVTCSLPESLDLSRSRSSGVVYKIERSGDATELNYTMFGLGFVFAGLGIALYYLFPVSLITLNLSLLFYIFFAILLGMLAGLVLLALNFERVLETVLSYVFLFWENAAVFQLIHKLLAAHRLRNRRTTLMYSMSLGFIIFITVAFSLQVTSFEYQTKRDLGAAVVFTPSAMTLDELHYIYEFVDAQVPDEVSGISYDFTYSNSYEGSILNTSIVTPGRYSATGSNLVCLAPNYYDVLDPAFLKVKRYNEDVARYGLSQALYASGSRSKVIMAHSDFDTLAMKTLEDGEVFTTGLSIETVEDGKSIQYARSGVKAIATLDASPSVSVRGGFLSASSLNVMTSVTSCIHFSGVPYLSVLSLTIRKVYFNVPRQEDIEMVRNKLQSFVYKSPTIDGSVTDSQSQVSTLKTADTILRFFFIFTMIMVLLLCFVSLLSSMATNVMESSKEVGILLCMGTTHFQIYRIFIWEAFILVISSGILGVFVGILVGYTMQLQNVLFTQLPLPFQFPWIQLVIVIGGAVLAAFLSSYSPVAFLLGFPSVTSILKQKG